MKKVFLIAVFVLGFALQGWGTTYNIGPGETYETFTELEAAVVLAGDDVVDGGGSTFREVWTPITSGTSGHPIILRNAVIYGSIQDTSSVWTNSTGTEYTTSYTTEPKAVVLVLGSVKTKLAKGTAGSLSSNQFDWGANILTISIGSDPNGQTFEIGQRDTCVGLPGRDYITVWNVTGLYSSDNGLSVSGTNSNLIITQSIFSYNGGDGVHINGTSTDIEISFCTVAYNGYNYNNTVDGQGDGISFHGGCTGSILDNTILYNYKAGVDNVEAGMIVSVLRNTVGYSPRGIWVGSLVDQTQVIAFNKIYVENDSLIDTFGLYIQSTAGAITTCVNNDVIGVGSKTGNSYGIQRIRSDLTLKNNVFENLITGQNLQNNVTEANDDDYNLLDNCSTNYLGSWTPGANNILNTFSETNVMDVGASVSGVNDRDDTDINGKYPYGPIDIGAKQTWGIPRGNRILRIGGGGGIF